MSVHCPHIICKLGVRQVLTILMSVICQTEEERRMLISRDWNLESEGMGRSVVGKFRPKVNMKVGGGGRYTKF